VPKAIKRRIKVGNPSPWANWPSAWASEQRNHQAAFADGVMATINYAIDFESQ